MPGTRLLIVADAKMLPALAGGLRDGEKFEVLTAPFSDPAGAQAAAEQADALAVFYGAPGAPLPAALQALAPKIRDRGGRVVAVLQREQAAQRDECFRAGASDLLFMPMPKEQFMARLSGSVGLSWAPEAGAAAPVSVATRSAASQVDKATVSPAGIESLAALPVKEGETVRLAWGTFQHWGLVVRGGPPLQIRFAGLAPDEEAQIRDWLKSGAAAATEAKPADAAPPAAAADGPRAAPAAGPPPGFADRKPIRPQTKAPTRIAPPVMAAAAPAAPAAAAPEAAPAPSAPAPTNGSDAATAPAKALSDIVAEGAAESAAPPTPAAPAAPVGPSWPGPAPLAASKTAAFQFLKDKSAPVDASPFVVASARKITGMLGSAERTALDREGPESHFAAALAARIALDAATAEALKLFSSTPTPSFDAPAAAAMTKVADEAAARLQKEANAAIGKGQVENLQLLTAASAALSRDLLSFKETADRLRGIGAAPRLGAGALDPDMVLPGQAPKPKPLPTSGPAPVKAELRDFRGLEQGTGRGKNVVALVIIIGAVVAAANGFYFALPHHSEVAVAGAGEGVTHIEIAGDVAMVTVTPEWVAHADSRANSLASLLKERGVKKAMLVLPSGGTTGVLDVTTFKIIGMPKKPAPK